MYEEISKITIKKKIIKENNERIKKKTDLKKERKRTSRIWILRKVMNISWY